MAEGKSIGYRRLLGDKPGSWIARRRVMKNGKQVYELSKLGSADDHADADGSDVLSWIQAQQKALAWTSSAKTNSSGELLVREAIGNYVLDYRARSNRATDILNIIINTHIVPTFGARKVNSLTTEELTQWRNTLAVTAPRRRQVAPGKSPRARSGKRVKVVGPWSPDAPDALRKRRASANRILGVLKAIFNFAFESGRVDSDLAWRRVKPFKNADEPRNRYLTTEQSAAFVQACDPDFRQIVIAALLTGADYGELRSVRVNACDPALRRLTVSAKRGPHSLVLTDEGIRHFATMSKGKEPDDYLFLRADGHPWGASHQQWRMDLASAKAGIVPGINFHILRHTYATHALRNGAAMQYVSKQLGHKSIKMTERHYAHVIPSDATEAILRAVPDQGLAPPDRKAA
jgi:integrase